MKAIKIFTNLFFALCLMVGFTSCLNSDDDYNGQATAADVATLTSLNGQTVTFSLPGANNTTVTLYSEQGSKIDPTTYPVGSRTYITYNYQTGQDLNMPVKIDLLSIAPVTTVNLTTVNQTPTLSYGPVSLSRLYYIGGYINIIVTTNGAESRTWKCYFDTTNSMNNTAHLYLDTEATNESPTTTTSVLSVNVTPVVNGSNYKNIVFHVVNQTGQNEITLTL